MTEYFREKMDLVSLAQICRSNKLDENAWRLISEYQNLTEALICEFEHQVNWYYISRYQNLSEPFIRTWKDRLNFEAISLHHYLSEPLIRECKDYVNWFFISGTQKLSEDFIREFKDYVDWESISAFQELSEPFIRTFAHFVNWENISTYQTLSEDFIREFFDSVDWEAVSRVQTLSETFRKEFKDRLDWYLINDSWCYKDAEFKKAAVIATGRYECHEDYFIAYKGIRRDRYSNFKFHYRYLPGNTYETFADTSAKESSFGFSVLSKDCVARFSPELTVTCKVYYSDVARVILDGYEIRCRKITILD